MLARITTVIAAGFPLVVLAALAFTLTLALGWQISDESDPAPHRVFEGQTLLDDSPPADVAGIVSDVDGDVVQIRVEDALLPVRIGSGALIQRLTPITPTQVGAGDWVIVGAVDDNSLNLVLQAVVVAGPDEVSP
jgi:hypothetical protein